MNAISQTNVKHRQIILIEADTPFPNMAVPVLTLTADKVNQYRQYLGTEHSCVFFDASMQFHADALLAVSGTIAGGGCLVLKLPNQLTPSLQRLVQSLQSAGINTEFTKAAALNNYLAIYAREADNLAEYATSSQSFTATAEQANALKKLEHFDAGAVVLNAPRGRGKSSLLGMWIHAAYSKYKFTLCAPSKRQAKQIFATTGAEHFAFIAPDQLSSYQQGEHEWLLIDEAASIPSHLLTDLAIRCQRLAIATTTEGYESAGRGFALRFQQQLPQYFANILTLELYHPVRWGLGDPLETALNQCFCVYAAESNVALSGQPTYQHVHASELVPEALEQAFTLLTSAHYQTSPNDLRLLLDDPKQHLFLQWHENTLTGVCWVASEGPITETLIAPIYQGKRRPPGQLLPQSMCFHLRSKDAARLSMQRIVRIAIVPAVQKHGAGTALLQHVLSTLNANADLIGTSFGVSEHLHHFWVSNGFVPLRIGQHIDAASGMYSALYAHVYANEHSPAASADSDNSRKLVSDLFNRFCTYFPYQYLKLSHAQQLQWLNAWVTKQQREEPQKSQILHTYLADFAAGHIPFELLQPILAEAAFNTELEYGLLTHCAVNASSLADNAIEAGFHGKADLLTHLRALAMEALNSNTQT
ncbi:GNAT family N-acetyltransferase [Aliidiomarina shirensis]|nr:GNAT family N-acetyltransferase [Aliidiomarina shirensis]